MYLPPQFESKDRAHALALMREHPFASLLSNDDEGFPFVTPMPLHVQEGADGALVPSPAVYPDLARVPSWNYLAVHCRVQATLIDGEQDRLAWPLSA